MIPENVHNAVTDYFMTPFRGAYLEMLNGIAGILVFFNIAASLCGDSDSRLLGKQSRRMLIRMPLIAAVRDRYPELVGVFGGMNHVVTTVTAQICRLCPLFVFCSLFTVIDTHGLYGTFRDLWKPVVLLISTGAVVTAVFLTVLRLRFRCGIIRFLKTISPAVLICLTTGSPIAAYSENVNILEMKLGVTKRFSRLGLSIGGRIYGPGLVLYLAVMVMFFAEKYQVPVNAGMILLAVFLTVILTFVCPPVSGGLLVIFGILASQFGFPDECLVFLVTVDLILDGIATGISCILRNAELLLEAGQYGELDRKVLERI